MRLGYSSLGDYARKQLKLAPRTAEEYQQLARGLRTRPILGAAVREGVVSRKRAMAILEVAVGDAEAEWVERAKRETVRALRVAVAAGKAGGEAEAGPEPGKKLERLVLELSPEERAAVDEAMDLAGRLLGATAPRGQRLEALCQEYLGAFPPPELEGPPRLPEVVFPCEERPSAAEARAWLEQEHQRWAGLYQQEPVVAPDPKVGDLDRARRIGARLGELAAMQRDWDELVGHLGYIIVSVGLWRDLGFADVGHYTTERLGMSERAFEQRVWLERRLWELPDVRQAMRDGKIGYAQARVIATCDEDEAAAWIEKAQHMTVITLQRAIEAAHDAQLCARRELELRLEADVRGLFSEACRAVRLAEQRWVPSAGCLAIIARHFTATWKEALKVRNTARNRAMQRDRGLCSVPGCSRAAGHSHHITPRGQGGSDEEWNRTNPCPPHHLRGIHMGYVRVRGRAPDQLIWELGEVE
jgi:hypothetical protein